MVIRVVIRHCLVLVFSCCGAASPGTRPGSGKFRFRHSCVICWSTIFLAGLSCRQRCHPLSHPPQIFHQRQRKFNTGQVQPQVVHQVPDKKDLADVPTGIQPQHTPGAVRIYQPQPLVLPQRLRVHVQDARRHADDVNALYLELLRLGPLTVPRCSLASRLAPRQPRFPRPLGRELERRHRPVPLPGPLPFLPGILFSVATRHGKYNNY